MTKIFSDLFQDIFSFKDAFKIDFKMDFDLFNGFKLFAIDTSKKDSDNNTNARNQTSTKTQTSSTSAMASGGQPSSSSGTVFTPLRLDPAVHTTAVAWLHRVVEENGPGAAEAAELLSQMEERTEREKMAGWY